MDRQTNGQSEEYSRCLVIIKKKIRKKRDIVNNNTKTLSVVAWLTNQRTKDLLKNRFS